MQDHNGASSCRVQAGQHAFEVHAAFFGIVVSITVDLKAGVGKQGAMVFPTGVGNHDLGIGADFFQKIGANFEAARAANALHCGYAARRYGLAVSTKNQAFDSRVVGGNAVDGQIATGCGLVHHGFFGRLHTFKQGEFAVVVEINAHTQVHFVGVGVGCELFVQTQDRIAGGHFDGGKQRHEKSPCGRL